MFARRSLLRLPRGLVATSLPIGGRSAQTSSIGKLIESTRLLEKAFGLPTTPVTGSETP